MPKAFDCQASRGDEILVVEDDPTVRSITSDVPEELSYVVLMVADARAARPGLEVLFVSGYANAASTGGKIEMWPIRNLSYSVVKVL